MCGLAGVLSFHDSAFQVSSTYFWAIPRFGIVGVSTVSSISYSLTCALILLMIVRTNSRLTGTA